MAAMRGREARDFKVVTHQVLARRELVVFGFEELFLIVITRPPGEYAADVKRFTQNVADHILRHHALRRAFVMHASGGVDVMIARIPAQLCNINPSFEFESECPLPIRADPDRLSFDQIFRPARVFDFVLTYREFDLLTVRAVDLRMEIEIWREPFEARRIDAILRVTNDKRRRRGFSVFVKYTQRHVG